MAFCFTPQKWLVWCLTRVPMEWLGPANTQLQGSSRPREHKSIFDLSALLRLREKIAGHQDP